MTTPACPNYAGYRFPAEVISYAVWLYFRFPLSLRNVDEILGRVCKLGLAGGRTGFSPVRHTMRLAEDPSNQLRSWTRAGPSHRSGSLQTRPSRAASSS